MVSLVRVALLLAAASLTILGAVHGGTPWDLRNYDRICKKTRLSGIRSEASGLTYSPVTNTIWVVTLKPMGVFEYDIDGDLLRRVTNLDGFRFKDPEGITWMHDHRFAVSQERSDNDRPSRRKSQITIFDLNPWDRRARHVRTLLIDDFRQANNKGLESITWDPISEEFIVGQEMDPIAGYRVDPRSGRTERVLRRAERSRELRDFAGMYYRPGDDGVYVLSRGSRSVLKLDGDGTLEPGQQSSVNIGRIPEGLTFTTDGALMFVVAEPHDLLVKSSTGSCSWSPSDDMLEQYPANTGSKPDSSEAPSDMEVGEEPREGEYCSWSRCDGIPEGTAFCRDNVDNCVGTCGGWWCSYAGEDPINDDNYDAPASPALPEAPSAGVSPPLPRQPVAPMPASSMNVDAQQPAILQDRLRVALDPIAAAALASQTPPADDEAEDEELQNGYLALLSLVLNGPVGGLDTVQEEAILANSAETAFGSPEASIMFGLSQPWGIQRRGLLQAEPVPADLAELTGGQPGCVVRLSILGETPAHAKALSRKIEAAIESGAFAADLGKSGLTGLQSVAVLGRGVQQAPMAPEHYPMLDNPTEQHGDVITVRFEADSFNFNLLTCLIAAGAGLLLLMGGSAAVWCLRRRSAQGTVQAAATEAKIGKPGSAAGAQELKEEVVLQMASRSGSWVIATHAEQAAAGHA
eukprot:jgi/Tetstr1/428848/TSEL_018835.t1